MHRRRTEYKRLEDGNYGPVDYPGNRTACLAKRACSFEPWSRQTESQCLAVGRANYCALCKGTYCDKISQFPSCSLSGSVTRSQCDSQGGVFTSYGSDQQGQCDVINRLANQTTCESGPTCATYNGKGYCGQSFCAKGPPASAIVSTTRTSSAYPAPTAVTQQQCGNGQDGFFWDFQRGLCLSSSIEPQACTNSGNTYYYGHNWNAGQYDTREKCTSACDDYTMRYQQADEQTCRNHQYCTTQCPACISRSNLPTACYAFNFNRAQCDQANGQFSQQVCNLQNYSNATSCATATNATWAVICTYFRDVDRLIQINARPIQSLIKSFNANGMSGSHVKIEHLVLLEEHVTTGNSEIP